MRVLAVETSTLSGGAALLDGERVVGEYTLDVRITHSERLMAAIDQLLTDAGWTARDLEGIAVTVGPGSFTGLRVGLSTVKGLALALSIPVAAVPTLDAMAAMLPFAALPVCPVLDARKREVYASLYRWDGLGMRRHWEYLAIAPDDLARRLERAGDRHRRRRGRDPLSVRASHRSRRAGDRLRRSSARWGARGSRWVTRSPSPISFRSICGRPRPS